MDRTFYFEMLFECANGLIKARFTRKVIIKENIADRFLNDELFENW